MIDELLDLSRLEAQAIASHRYGRMPIAVRVAQNDRHFRLSVDDHGDGVAPGFVPTLFERFSREHGADVPGPGLGLSIAQA